MRTMAILRGAAGAAVLAASVTAGVGQAQEVVQPLPSPYSEKLSSALQRLARNSGDVNALLDAGEAALELRDIPAAIGFFGRAKDVSPNNSRVSLGLARAYTLSRRPVEALRLFAEAERGGIAQAVMAKDRALAFDLVGDSASAQQLYRLALAHGAGDEVQRNLALSQAISGDRAGFEATLVPLLQKNDLAGFRTRAFGLAILGDTEGAVDIAQTMMTPQVASRVAPYLRYMPKLTPAQQAAAGNLGIFPQTSAIGRDDADIAAYSGSGVAVPAAVGASALASGAQLMPSGPPMGQARQPNAQPSIASSLTSTRRTDPVKTAPAAPPPQPRDNTPVAQPVPTPAKAPQGLDVINASDPMARTLLRGRAMNESDGSALDAARESQQREVVQPARQPAASASSAPVPPSTKPVELPSVAGPPTVSPNAGGIANSVAASVPAPTARAPVIGPPSAPPPSVSAVVVATQPQVQPQFESRPVEQPVPEPVPSVSDAFAGFDLDGGLASATPRKGAVDITRIEIPREVEAPPPPPAPPPPVHPSRHWVQVATGKDLSALAFDWRRIAGKSDGILTGKGPFTTPWVEANRLLAGPYDSARAAREVVNELKAKGVNSFPFTSDKGQEISSLR